MRIVVALGGNAIAKDGKATYTQQSRAVTNTAKQLVELVRKKHQLIITHGNGPQVGNILLQQDALKEIPPMPLSVADAETQGEIGYLIQQKIGDQLKKAGLKKSVVTIITQILVDKRDPSFRRPTKPIGPYYSEAKAKEVRRKYTLVKQKKRWRRVVPSPKPLQIIEEGTILTLMNQNNIVITCGGGGIPIIEHKNSLVGVDAVIDKDRSAALLALTTNADLLLILTNVQGVYRNYREKDQVLINQLNVKQAEYMLASGVLPEGSMGPKLESAVAFVKGGSQATGVGPRKVRSRSGKKAIIASLNKIEEALKGKSGTMIVP